MTSILTRHPQQQIPAASVVVYCNHDKRAELVPSSCQPSETMKQFDEIYASGNAVWGRDTMQEKEDFYSNANWPPKERKSASGEGSHLGHATNSSLDVIRKTIERYNVTTMIDLPCGDVNWIFDSWETDSLELYIGLDVVSAVIARNKERLKHHFNKIFEHWDGTTCPLPKYKRFSDGQIKTADLVHSRDVIQHLSQEQGVKFLCGVMTSGARVLIATSYPGGRNPNIKAGEWTAVNLHLPPYDIPRGDCVATHPLHEPDETCVYDLTEDWSKDWVIKKGCMKTESVN